MRCNSASGLILHLAGMAFICCGLPPSASADEDRHPLLMDHLYGDSFTDIQKVSDQPVNYPTSVDRGGFDQSTRMVQEVPTPEAFSMGAASLAGVGMVAGFRKLKRRYA